MNEWMNEWITMCIAMWWCNDYYSEWLLITKRMNNEWLLCDDVMMMYVITYLMSEWHTVNDYRNDECDNDTTTTMMMMWCDVLASYIVCGCE